MFIIVVWFIAGFSIGLILDTTLGNNREKPTRDLFNSQQDVIEAQELYVNDLERMVSMYENAMNQTLEENIYLRKKLKGM